MTERPDWTHVAQDELVATGPATTLEIAKSLVQQVKARHLEVAEAFPEAFTANPMATWQGDLMVECDQALERLTAPSLSIAMMGTTSSGKSTLVNGLLGRRIAPIESGEMSAGVLRILSGRETSLRVTSLGVDSDQGTERTSIDDEDCYHEAQEVMYRYHESLKTGPVVAPLVEVRGPILSDEDPSCLHLPPGVTLEFLDLPGLKSISDQANLSVIQSTIGRSFSLVALDYSQTDADHRKKLLEELREVVVAMDGRTDLMAFLLNRVDIRSSDDKALDERLRLMAIEIQGVLGLRTRPALLPMSGRLLYWAQCSWGPTAVTGSPSTDPGLRVQYLRHLFEECASDLNRMSSSSRDARTLIRSVQDELDDGRPPSEEEHRQLVLLAREHSGADQLWTLLNRRLAESFAEVVVLPAVIGVLNAHERLAKALRTTIFAREQESLEAIGHECRQLKGEHRRLTRELRARADRVSTDIERAQDLLASGEYAEQLNAQHLLGEGMVNMTDATNAVKVDINDSLVHTLAAAYAKRRKISQLRTDLQTDCLVPPHLAEGLVESLDGFWIARHELGKPDSSHDRKSKPGTETWRARADDKRAVAALKDLERHLLEINHDGAAAIEHTARFRLQAQAGQIRHGVEMLIRAQRAEVAGELSALTLMAPVRDQLQSEVELSLRPDAIILPPGMFETDLKVKRHRDTRTEQTGTQTKTRKRGWWIFKWKEKYTVPVYEAIDYRTVEIPTDDGFKSMWTNAVDAAVKDLQASLFDWVRKLLDEAELSFEIQVDQVMTMATQALAARTHELETQTFATSQRRSDLESLVDHTDAAVQDLRDMGR